MTDPLEANLAHIALIVEKRNRLTVAAADASEALVEELRRIASVLTLSEKATIWEQCRGFEIPWLSARVCEAMGTSVAHLTHYLRFPTGSHNPGTFPIGYADLPNRGTPCVYILMDDDMRCLYVGQSQQVKPRLKAHWTGDVIPCTRYEVIVCDDKYDALQLEADLIYQHQPPYNKAGTKRRGYVA